MREYQAHHIEPPGTTVTTTKSELLTFFETMYRMRRMEIAADMLYKSKFIRGFCHLYALPCLVMLYHYAALYGAMQ